MKKLILKATLVAAFAVVAGLNVYNSQKEDVMSDLALANVEALASGEGSSDRFLIVNRREMTQIDENGNQYTVIVLDCQDVNPLGYICE